MQLTGLQQFTPPQNAEACREEHAGRIAPNDQRLAFG